MNQALRGFYLYTFLSLYGIICLKGGGTMRRLASILMLLLLCTTAFAHGGRTDSSGGHMNHMNVDNVNPQTGAGTNHHPQSSLPEPPSLGGWRQH